MCILSGNGERTCHHEETRVPQRTVRGSCPFFSHPKHLSVAFSRAVTRLRTTRPQEFDAKGIPKTYIRAPKITTRWPGEVQRRRVDWVGARDWLISLHPPRTN